MGLHCGVSNQSDLLTSVLHIIYVILGNTPEWNLNEYGIDANRNVCEQLSLLKYKRLMRSLNMLITILTINMLICFKGYNRDIYILNGLCLTQVDEINPGTIMYVVCPTQLISCLLMLWRLFRSLCISRHGIKSQSQNILSPASEELSQVSFWIFRWTKSHSYIYSEIETTHCKILLLH